MESNKRETKKGKTGLIPNDEIKGSDADKAYDENGDFGQPQTKNPDPQKPASPPGADADS